MKNDGTSEKSASTLPKGANQFESLHVIRGGKGSANLKVWLVCILRLAEKLYALIQNKSHNPKPSSLPNTIGP